MSTFDALLGRIYSGGVERELAGGLDFRGSLQAVRNASTNRIDITLADVADASDGESGLMSDTDKAALDSLFGRTVQGSNVSIGTGTSWATVLDVPAADAIATDQMRLVGWEVSHWEAAGANPRIEQVGPIVLSDVGGSRAIRDATDDSADGPSTEPALEGEFPSGIEWRVEYVDSSSVWRLSVKQNGIARTAVADYYRGESTRSLA